MTPTLKKILLGGIAGLGGVFLLRAFFKREVGTPMKLPAPRLSDAVLPVLNAKVTSLFGPRKPPTSGASSNHPGIDFAAPAGTVVRAYASGRIKAIKSRHDGNAAGNRVQIEHDNGTQSWYFHLQDDGFAQGWRVNDRVAAGMTIGRVGVTGTSTGPHLHFEIRKTGPGEAWKTAYNPAPFLFPASTVASLEARRVELNRVA